MKTVILGNGLIAKSIARRMAIAKQEVTIVSRNIEDKIEDVSYQQFTFEEIVNNRDLFLNADTVIHTISTTAPANSMADIYKDAYENVLLNIKLIALLSELKIRKFIFLSSGGAVYGNPGEGSVTEEHSTNPVSAYGIAKLSVEKYLYLYGVHAGLNYLILRPSNIYGYIKSIKKPQGVINHFLDCVLHNKIFKLWGSLHNSKDYLYIDDFVDAVLLVLNYQFPFKSRIYNVSSGANHSLEEIVSIIEQKTGKKLLIEQAGETKFDVTNIKVNSTLFMADFNWKPKTDISTGIASIIEQY